MNRIFLILPFLLVLGLKSVAQDDTTALPPIQFATMECAGDKNLSIQAQEAIITKTTQILTRNSANAADGVDVFGIYPSLIINDIKSTDGLVKNVSMASGEFMLTAINKIDETVYNSVTVPVKCEVVGNKDLSIALIQNIKATDPVFTRFIRNTRKRITEYFAENCDLIINKARGLCAQRRYEECLYYLQGVPANAPCFNTALEMIDSLPWQPTPQDTVREQTIIIVPIAVPTEPQPASDPQTQPSPTPQTAPTTDTPTYSLFISSPKLNFKIISCQGERINRRITINAVIENQTDKNWNFAQSNLVQAISNDGYNLSGIDNGNKFDDIPAKVPIRTRYIINDVQSECNVLAFVKLNIAGITVEIRQLPVAWN